MKKITLLFSLMTLLSAAHSFSQEQAPAPVFKDDDFWHFKITEDIANVSSTRELHGVYELSTQTARSKFSTCQVVKGANSRLIKLTVPVYSAGFGIRCIINSYGDGRIGTLNGTSGAISFAGNCVNATSP